MNDETPENKTSAENMCKNIPNERKYSFIQKDLLESAQSSCKPTKNNERSKRKTKYVMIFLLNENIHIWSSLVLFSDVSLFFFGLH